MRESLEGPIDRRRTGSEYASYVIGQYDAAAMKFQLGINALYAVLRSTSRLSRRLMSDLGPALGAPSDAGTALSTEKIVQKCCRAMFTLGARSQKTAHST